MTTSRKIAWSGFLIIAVAVTTVVFQNCSKVNYKELTGDGKVNPNSVTKTISINPTFNSQSADLKVLLVVDDSYTMSQSQTKLSTAMDSLLNPLFGRNVEYKIVSTSGVPSNQIDYSLDKKYYNSLNQEISQAQANNSGSYSIETYVNNTLTTRHQKFSTLKNFTQAQFDSVKTNIKKAILQVGTNGSDSEEGSCAALRQLFDSSTNRFFKKGDKAAIIILTDEDDGSQFKNCVSKYQEKVSNSPTVFYNYLQQRARLQLEYQATRDGIITWIPASWAIGLPQTSTFVASTSCTSADQQAALQKISAKGYTVRNVTSCVYEATQTTHYGVDLGDDGSSNLNLCMSPVTYQGISYPNLYSFVTASGLSAVNGSCERVSQSSNSIVRTDVFTSVISSDSAAHQMKDLHTAFLNKTSELFGQGFFVASIIRKQNESCSLQTGQSYGLKYLDLTDKLGQNAITESLCASNFSTVLNQISQFIIDVATNSYVIPDFKTTDKVTSVQVVRSTQTINLTTSQYEVVGSTLTLIDFNLQQGDILKVTIESVQ